MVFGQGILVAFENIQKLTNTFFQLTLMMIIYKIWMNYIHVVVESGPADIIMKQVGDHASFALAFCMILSSHMNMAWNLNTLVEKPDYF